MIESAFSKKSKMYAPTFVSGNQRKIK